MLGRWTLRRVLRDTVESVPLTLASRPSQHAISTRIEGGSRRGIYSLTTRNRARPLRHDATRLTNLRSSSRGLITAAIPTILVPPLIFVGLLLSLWAWKCFWIIVLQDRLLYISWLPPFARSDKITDYEAECRPVRWQEKHIRSLDGTKLAICEGRIPGPRNGPSKATLVPGSNNNNAQREIGASNRTRSVVICYFQGNGGSTPMRLPLLSKVLRTITETAMARSASSTSSASSTDDSAEYTVLALSYRGYWTSSGRASQSGIEMDAQAFLDWVSETYARPNNDLHIILWGHSLGSAIATTAAATYLCRHYPSDNNTAGAYPPTPPAASANTPAPIAGLVLEAPTSSIKDMLISLYPQKWLPYRYLGPFSWNNWNISGALERISHWRDQSRNNQERSRASPAPHPPPSSLSAPPPPPPIFVLSAQNDEVIPSYVPADLLRKGRDLRLQIEAVDVPRALHTEAPLKMEGRNALVDFILRNTSSAGHNKT